MQKNEKHLGAQSATEVVSAGSIASDTASHAAPETQFLRNLDKARDLLWLSRHDDRLFAEAVKIFEESAHLCGSVEATDRMKARLIGPLEKAR